MPTCVWHFIWMSVIRMMTSHDWFSYNSIITITHLYINVTYYIIKIEKLNTWNGPKN